MVPLLGERTAELLEMPLMLGVIVATAAWLVRRRLEDGRLSSALAVGFIALGMVLMADLAVGIGLRGLSATEVFLDRDPVSGAVYYAALLCFAVMPTIITHVQQSEPLPTDQKRGWCGADANGAPVGTSPALPRNRQDQCRARPRMMTIGSCPPRFILQCVRRLRPASTLCRPCFFSMAQGFGSRNTLFLPQAPDIRSANE